MGSGHPSSADVDGARARTWRGRDAKLASELLKVGGVLEEVLEAAEALALLAELDVELERREEEALVQEDVGHVLEVHVLRITPSKS